MKSVQREIKLLVFDYIVSITDTQILSRKNQNIRGSDFLVEIMLSISHLYEQSPIREGQLNFREIIYPLQDQTCRFPVLDKTDNHHCLDQAHIAVPSLWTF